MAAADTPPHAQLLKRVAALQGVAVEPRSRAADVLAQLIARSHPDRAISFGSWLGDDYALLRTSRKQPALGRIGKRTQAWAERVQERHARFRRRY